jgi:glutathionyl-hydroquinone reductase
MAGKLIDGVWTREGAAMASKDGRYRRQETDFRDWISAEPGAKFAPETGRYHLYVSYACPWAHRALIFRAIKGLQAAISVSFVNPVVAEDGWEFSDAGAYSDQLFGLYFLHEIYTRADPDYTGRVSVPVLWDKKLNTIVSNESAEIIRMFNSVFVGVAGNDLDFAPDDLLPEIDQVNDLVYQRINNGVYKCGFAGNQEAYEEAATELFDALDTVEKRLDGSGHLVGGRLTEADWRLFTTLIRFDQVYVALFKCNLRRISDYPNLSAFRKRLYEFGNVSETVKFEEIKKHYWASLHGVNPSGIVPVGPEVVL